MPDAPPAFDPGDLPRTDTSDPLILSHALQGQPYHLASLGISQSDRLEMMAAGLSLGSVIEVLSGEGRRPRVVACGNIRAAIGHDLAQRVALRRCDPGCRCQRT